MDARSREYLHIPITSPDSIAGKPVAVSIDDGVTWHAAEHETGGVRILAGAGTPLAMQPGVVTILVRVSDNPEIPVLDAGRLLVT